MVTELSPELQSEATNQGAGARCRQRQDHRQDPLQGKKAVGGVGVEGWGWLVVYLAWGCCCGRPLAISHCGHPPRATPLHLPPTPWPLQAAGVTLGPIKSVSDSNLSPPTPMPMAGERCAGLGRPTPTPVSIGEQDVSCAALPPCPCPAESAAPMVADAGAAAKATPVVIGEQQVGQASSPLSACSVPCAPPLHPRPTADADAAPPCPCPHRSPPLSLWSMLSPTPEAPRTTEAPRGAT